MTPHQYRRPSRQSEQQVRLAARDHVSDAEAVARWKAGRAKTLAAVERGKAAAAQASTPEAVEAARVKALTPEQRQAESDARKNVTWARGEESDARSAFVRILHGKLEGLDAARETIRRAEAEVERLEADHKRIIEEHHQAKRRRPPEVLSEREIEAKRFRSLSRKQREAERLAEYEERQRAGAVRDRLHADHAARWPNYSTEI